MADRSIYKKIYKVDYVKSIKEMVERAATENPNRLAYRYRSGKEIVDVTFKEFYELTLTHCLHRRK